MGRSNWHLKLNFDGLSSTKMAVMSTKQLALYILKIHLIFIIEKIWILFKCVFFKVGYHLRQQPVRLHCGGETGRPVHPPGRVRTQPDQTGVLQTGVRPGNP